MISKESLEKLKELAETRDCSIHWRSEYNIALDEAIKELESENILAEKINLDYYQEPTFRSEVKIGNMTFYTEKNFNWFNRFMMKVIFGWEVRNLK